MANTRVGTGSFVIEPDLTGFRTEILAAVGAVGRAIDTQIGDSLDRSAAGFGASLRRQVQGANLLGGISNGGNLAGRNLAGRMLSGFRSNLTGFSSAVSGALGAASGGMSSLATGALGIAAGAGGAAFGLSKIAQVADQANQAASLSSVVFGDAASAIDAMGQSQRGLSQGAFLDIANNLGSQLSGSGWSQDAAAGLTTSIMDRLPDIAAAANRTSSEVAEALQSAFVGEYDPLQRLPGLGSITSASIMDRATSMTGKSEGDLSAQEKQLALIEEINAKTSQFEGFANAEFDTSFTAQLETLKAEFADLMTGDFGQGVLSGAIQVVQYLSTNGIPLVEQFVNTLNFTPDGIEGFMDTLLGAGMTLVSIMPAIMQVGSSLLGIAQTVLPYVAIGLQFVADNIGFITTVLPYALGLFAAFRIVPPLMALIGSAIALATNPIFLIGAGIAVITAAVLYATGTLQGFIDWISNVLDWIKDLAGSTLTKMGVDTSAFDGLAGFSANQDAFKVDASMKKEQENSQMKALERMRMNVDLDGQTAALKRDRKASTTNALGTFDIYNV